MSTRILKERDPIPGRVLPGAFTVVARLASGGVSDVYVARQPSVGNRNVAVKLLKKVICASKTREAELHRRRFKFEAELLCMLRHTCFVRVFEAGSLTEEVERPYLVMEYLEGPQLSEPLRNKQRFPLAEAARLTLTLAEALQEMHRYKVLMRDLSPANVILEKGGPSGTVPRLFDLSHAVVEGIHDMDPGMADAPTLAGTPAYAAPELLTGSGDVRSDVFSLAGLFYAMMTAGPPVNLRSNTWEDYAAAMARLHWVPESSLREELGGKVPGDLDTVLKAAMAPRPEQRYASVTEFMADFCEVLIKAGLVGSEKKESLLTALVSRLLLR
jgi:serine/threonine-protein kinase